MSSRIWRMWHTQIKQGVLLKAERSPRGRLTQVGRHAPRDSFSWVYLAPHLDSQAASTSSMQRSAAGRTDLVMPMAHARTQIGQWHSITRVGSTAQQGLILRALRGVLESLSSAESKVVDVALCMFLPLLRPQSRSFAQ